MSKPVRQAVNFTWNAGAWFGGQLGSSLWLFISGLVLLPTMPGVAVAMLALFGGLNLLATLAWLGRRRLPPYLAYQGLILMMGLGSLLAVFLLDRAGAWARLQVGGSVSVGTMYLLLLVMVPVLMLRMHLQARASAKAHDASQPKH